MLYLKEEDYKKLVAYCRVCLPQEACGLIGGKRDNGCSYIEALYFLTNVEASGRHFFMAPAEQFAAIHDMRQKGYELLGNFHSHPAAVPVPSEEDQRLAYDASLKYLILSLYEEAQPQLKAYVRNETETMVEEPLCII